jgi:hypothetical protein
MEFSQFTDTVDRFSGTPYLPLIKRQLPFHL